ncbi:MAG: ParB/RepB/Spo0J family partition protein [Bacilli bacterium]|nr:ParB/RepB/Spo0J family partition protein [Bacilli bacterium]
MENNSEVVYLYLDDIIPNRFQPREVFDDQALKELAVSIKEHGVIQPIIVRKVENKYEIIAGERRYKASTMAGLTKIPAIVKNLDDKESSKVALIENLQRKDLTPIEEARTYQKILELEDDMTQEELAATMGKTQSSVSNKLRLLALPDEIQDALLKEKISERHARSLLNIDDKNEQIRMMGRIIDEKMTVRELDKVIKEMKDGGANVDSNTLISTPENNSLEVGNNTVVNNPFLQGSNANSEVSTSQVDSFKVPSVTSESSNLMNATDVVNDETKEKESIPTFTMPSIPILEQNNEVRNDTIAESNINNEVQDDKPVQNLDINPTIVDINKIRENSVDIGGLTKESQVEVKDLMKDPSQVDNGGFKFVQAMDNNQTQNNEGEVSNNFANYFNANVSNIPTSDNTVASTIAPIGGITIPTGKDINTAINDIKNTIQNLETNGYKVSFEEQDDVSNYKIVINLQKNA